MQGAIYKPDTNANINNVCQFDENHAGYANLIFLFSSVEMKNIFLYYIFFKNFFWSTKSFTTPSWRRLDQVIKCSVHALSQIPKSTHNETFLLNEQLLSVIKNLSGDYLTNNPILSAHLIMWLYILALTLVSFPDSTHSVFLWGATGQWIWQGTVNINS